jgi:HSP20 family molecular chaperone IbpA
MPDDRYDPVRDLMAIRDNLAKAINQGLRTAENIPAIDVYETETDVVIVTEPLAGVDPSTIEVSMEDDVVVINGETQPARHLPDEAYLIQEIYYGPFTRSIRIPRSIQVGKAKASFRQNVLTVTLPKLRPDVGDIIDVTPTA